MNDKKKKGKQNIACIQSSQCMRLKKQILMHGKENKREEARYYKLLRTDSGQKHFEELRTGIHEG